MDSIHQPNLHDVMNQIEKIETQEIAHNFS